MFGKYLEFKLQHKEANIHNFRAINTSAWSKRTLVLLHPGTLTAVRQL